MKILIIDSSKEHQNYLKEEIEKNLLFTQCDICSSYKEYQSLNEEYDVYICDYFLKDCNGIHITEMINQNKDVILLTDSIDNLSIDTNLRNELLEVIIKHDRFMIDYLVRFLKRLHKNRDIKCMIVEDSFSIREYMKKLLKKIKIVSLEASNGIEAINIISKNKIDFVITDLNMPLMSGCDLIKFIRRKYSLSELPIIVISSKEKNVEFNNSLKLGANDYIKKPFSKDELLLRINNLLELYDNFKKINRKLEKDSLTDVYNRYFLENKLEKVFQFYDNKSIIMTDIDFFKKINDNYGHQYGDKILKHFVSILKNNIRKGDFIIRYGGEEFLIFMPNTNKKEAFIVMLKIKKLLKNTPYNYTFSAGICDEGKSLAEMIRIADERLYKAKREGRDKIVIE